MIIDIKSDREILLMREASKLAAKTLNNLKIIIKPGISTFDIDQYVKKFFKENNAIAATLGYGEQIDEGIPPFPAYCCTSVNDVACHGIPSKNCILKEGDIINVDVTPILNGYHGDASMMYSVGKISDLAIELLDKTKESMLKGISVIKPNVRIKDIGKAIQECINDTKFSIVPQYVGHGIGTIFHTAPQIPHCFPSVGMNTRLREGMTFTVEPIINAGSPDTYIENDGWTVKTKDSSLSAQYEHTILVTDVGFEILTME